jgi:ABC-2 type transport system permease protein
MSAAIHETFQPWIGFYTVFHRETRRYMKLAGQTLIAPFLSQLLFLAVFGGAYGLRTVGDGNVPYLRFLVPGLVLSGAFLAAFQNPVFSLVAMKYQGTLKDYCLYPIPALSRFSAFAMSGAIRGLLVSVMIYISAGIFAGFKIGHPLAFWTYVFVISLMAAASGTAIGFRLESFEQANFIVGLILTPAMFLSGVYYDYRDSGIILEKIARINPLTTLVSSGRSLYLKSSFPVNKTGIIITVAFFTVLAVWTMMTIITEKGLKTE